MESNGVVLFPTTSAALRAERVLLRTALRVKLAPVPRELSSDCSLALHFAWEQADRVRAALTEAGVPISGLHPFPIAQIAHLPERSPEMTEAGKRQADVLGIGEAVVVAMSGGVDSSVAAALLVKEGRRVVGVTLRIWSDKWPVNTGPHADRCCSVGAVADARAVAEHLRIPHYVVDCQDEFDREIIHPFVASYVRGETPNPCIWCNARLKFDWLRNRLADWGASHVATGHYARVDHDAKTGHHRLWRGADPKKDQSYFLYMLNQEQLAATLFPVGGLRKDETRRIAREMALPVAEKPESQEICFVGGDYRAFLRTQAGDAIQPGLIRDTAGKVCGRHPGVAYFTVGQRHGLGLANPFPLYVVALDAARSEVIVGSEEALLSNEVEVDQLHIIAPEPLQQPKRVLAKLRYVQPAAPALLQPISPDRVCIVFQEPQRAAAVGQAAVFYDAEEPDLVLGGGTIAQRRQGTEDLAGSPGLVID